MPTRAALVVFLLVLGGCGDPATEEPPTPANAAASVTRDPSAIRIQLHASGNAILLSQGSDTAADGMVALAAGPPEEQAEALRWLRGQLQARTADPATREPDRSSRLWFELELDPDARWQYAQWLLQLGAEPQVGLYKIRTFALGHDDPMTMLLPKDRGLTEDLLEEDLEEIDEEIGEVPVDAPVTRDAPSPARLRVRLFRRDADHPARAFTRIRIGDDLRFELPPGPGTSTEAGAAYEAVFEDIEQALRTASDAAGGSLRGAIATPPPFGLYVPCRDVLRVLRAFRTVGVEDVTFEGTPAPLRR